MNDAIKTTEQSATEPRELHKPARPEADVKMEELVTYSDESGGGSETLPPTIPTPGPD
jgi:hypothetical protein